MSRRDLSARLEEEVSDFKIHDLNNWAGAAAAGGHKNRPASVETGSNDSRRKSRDSNEQQNHHQRKLTYGTVGNSTAHG